PHARLRLPAPAGRPRRAPRWALRPEGGSTMKDLDHKVAPATGAESRSSSRWPGAHWLIPVIVAVLAYVAPSVAQPDRYTETILVMIAIFAVLALSTDLLLGRLGLPSMANGALFAVGAYTLSILTAQH